MKKTLNEKFQRRQFSDSTLLFFGTFVWSRLFSKFNASLKFRYM